MKPNLIEIKNLKTLFFTEQGPLFAVRDISFSVRPGEIVGLVGESGCGKSVTALSILRLLPPSGKIAGGQILFEGRDLLQLPEKEMQHVRGNKISMVFQEPMTSLNPLMKVGDQVAESLIIHKKRNKKDARQETIALLEAVRIPDPSSRYDDYPHQLSGGMRQRIMIAMAIACRPLLVIADEPTTALDVTIQAQILDLLVSLQKQFQLSILLITHALGVIAEIADRVVVMYAGQIVEEAPVKELFANPCHPYTVGLLESIPSITLEGQKKKRLKTIEGTVPSLLNLPPGCCFYDRCNIHTDVCTTAFPEYTYVGSEHRVACYNYHEIARSRSPEKVLPG